LTQEDWQEVLYNGMSKTSAWAALYFIFLMTFGNYVLFNLLVAILVEGFATEVCSRTFLTLQLLDDWWFYYCKLVATWTGVESARIVIARSWK